MRSSRTQKARNRQREATKYNNIYQQVNEQFGMADIDTEIQEMKKAELDGLKGEFGQKFSAPEALPGHWTDKDIEKAIGGLKEFQKRITRLANEASAAYAEARGAQSYS